MTIELFRIKMDQVHLLQKNTIKVEYEFATENYCHM